jgi:hypothetical protein
MALNLQIVMLTVPQGMEFPGSFQELGDRLAEYLDIEGDEDFSGVNFGDVEPTPENRDKPWFRLDDQGSPLGWYSWNGSAWVSIPLLLPSGPTSSRPVSATLGQLYEDTDIDVTLKFNGSAWVTVAGSPGDMKFVIAPTSADAITRNPGWSLDTSAVGVVISGASSGSSGQYGSTAGAESVALVKANLPQDTISLKSGWGVFPGSFQNGSQSPGVYPITTGLGAGATEVTASMNGGVTQIPVSVLQPTLYRWALVKD